MILILANDQVYVLFYFTCVNLIFPSCFMIIVFKSFFIVITWIKVLPTMFRFRLFNSHCMSSENKTIS